MCTRSSVAKQRQQRACVSIQHRHAAFDRKRRKHMQEYGRPAVLWAPCTSYAIVLRYVCRCAVRPPAKRKAFQCFLRERCIQMLSCLAEHTRMSRHPSAAHYATPFLLLINSREKNIQIKTQERKLQHVDSNTCSPSYPVLIRAGSSSTVDVALAFRPPTPA